MQTSRSDTKVKPKALKIVVAEYPKSGGTWLVSMLGDALRLPKRDIYVGDGYDAFDVTKHPWYMDAPSLGLTEACVIKSHEHPGSPLIDFAAHYVHLVRDGRDVVISRFFFERDFCVANGIYDSFDVPFDQYLKRIAAEWRDFVLAWLDLPAVVCRYEDLLNWPCASLQEVLRGLKLDVPVNSILSAVDASTKDKMKQALDRTFVSNTFIRTAMNGDWRNYFSPDLKESFKQIAGDALIRLGYEIDLNW